MKTKYIILLFTTLTVCTGVKKFKKTHKQKLYGTWEMVGNQTRERKGDVTTISEMTTLIHFNKDGTGYKKSISYSIKAFKQDSLKSKYIKDTLRFGQVVKTPFKYKLQKDDIGNKIEIVYNNPIIEKVEVESVGKNDEIIKLLKDFYKDRVDKFYWKIIPDTNHFNVKSFSYYMPGTTRRVYYHYKSKKYENL